MLEISDEIQGSVALVRCAKGSFTTLATTSWSPGVGDMDQGADVDLDDLPQFIFCLQGPEYTYVEGNFCLNGDADDDQDVDLADFASFQRVFEGS